MENTNPLLAKVKLPGRVFQLPSRGALYKNGEVTSAEGEVHVHPMSALDEIELKNPDLLFNGDAINKVFATCVPEIKKATQLFNRDIDAIMFFLRLVTYGPDFEINVAHDCQESIVKNLEGEVVLDPTTKEPKHKVHSYVVNLEALLQEMQYLDPTVVDQEYKVTLDNEQVVYVNPVRFEHMIKLYQLNAGKEEFTAEDLKKNVVFNLVNLIDNVDGVTNKTHIEQWVRTITTPYQNRITDAIEKTNEWGPKQASKLKCKDCGAGFDVDLPLNPISFFSE